LRCRREGKDILGSVSPAKPTVVFDTYWRFAFERQRIFFCRRVGAPYPWTQDPVLARFKFTNAYRVLDRVSQYLVRNVIYREDLPTSAEEVVFRILLFKFFNKIETWEALEATFGPISLEAFDVGAYGEVLSRRMAADKRIYSAAYIMPPGRSAFGHASKHRNHLELLRKMMDDRLGERLGESRRMQQGFELLRSYPTIGDFLAYQFITDINYSEVTDFSEMEFVVPGPGARDGIRKCFADRGGLTESELIRLLADNQEQHFESRGLSFQSLWGRRLQLIDCQNLFCEVDKYARVAHPEIAGLTGRTRIKQSYVPLPPPPQVWLPPKWGLNTRVESRIPECVNPEREMQPHLPLMIEAGSGEI
jgi:hypothetical protein